MGAQAHDSSECCAQQLRHHSMNEQCSQFLRPLLGCVSAATDESFRLSSTIATTHCHPPTRPSLRHALLPRRPEQDVRTSEPPALTPAKPPRTTPLLETSMFSNQGT